MTKDGIKVGFIGFVPPQIMLWDAKNLEGKAMTRDILQAARAWVPQMKEDGCDIVIALSHSGIDGNGQSERMVVSPGHEEKGLLVIPGGQSGHPLSPYYRADHPACPSATWPSKVISLVSIGRPSAASAL